MMKMWIRVGVVLVRFLLLELGISKSDAQVISSNLYLKAGIGICFENNSNLAPSVTKMVTKESACAGNTFSAEAGDCSIGISTSSASHYAQSLPPIPTGAPWMSTYHLVGNTTYGLKRLLYYCCDLGCGTNYGQGRTMCNDIGYNLIDLSDPGMFSSMASIMSSGICNQPIVGANFSSAANNYTWTVSGKPVVGNWFAGNPLTPYTNYPEVKYYGGYLWTISSTHGAYGFVCSSP